MTNIKIVYFDTIALDNITFENRLRNVCQSIYIIKDGLAMVHYNGSAHELFNQLVPNDNRYNVLVTDLDVSSDSYWGFMNRDLWNWMRDNFNKSNA